MAIELVSLHSRPDLKNPIYDVTLRNWERSNMYEPEGSAFPFDFNVFTRLCSSAEGNIPLPDSDAYIDLKAVIDTNTEEVVGSVDVFHDGEDSDTRQIGVVIDVDRGHGNKGYSKMAIAEAVRMYSLDERVEKLVAQIRPENDHSIKAFRSSGFVLSNIIDAGLGDICTYEHRVLHDGYVASPAGIHQIGASKA